MNRFAVHNGEIHYRDYSKEPSVDVVADQVQMVAVNFTNSKKLSKSLIADIRMEGRPLRSGNARAQISLDPYAARPTLAVNVEMSDIPLLKLNDFAKAYGGFTFKEGTFKMAMEANAKQGGYQGYVEPVFDHMVIFNEESVKNPATFVWEAIVGALTRIVRNFAIVGVDNRFGLINQPARGVPSWATPSVCEYFKLAKTDRRWSTISSGASGLRRNPAIPAFIKRSSRSR